MNIISREQIQNAAEPEVERRRLIEEYRTKFANPYKSAELGYIDDVIDPADTRPRLVQALRMLKTKRDINPPKKHGNIPL